VNSETRLKNPASIKPPLDDLVGTVLDEDRPHFFWGASPFDPALLPSRWSPLFYLLVVLTIEC
jgi:hypothetical protein